jgi:cyanophycinase-like exopeptidase
LLPAFGAFFGGGAQMELVSALNSAKISLEEARRRFQKEGWMGGG